MPFKIVISEPKTRKSYQTEKDALSLIGLKIGDKFDGSTVGLTGFTLQVMGGSDKDGFPMKPDLEGGERRKLLLTKGIGFKPTKEGQKRRKYVRGNMISDSIIQVNVKVVEGEGDIATIIGWVPKPKEEKKEEPAGKKRK
jgi:small subunit ribosomal protein S6e